MSQERDDAQDEIDRQFGGRLSTEQRAALRAMMQRMAGLPALSHYLADLVQIGELRSCRSDTLADSPAAPAQWPETYQRIVAVASDPAVTSLATLPAWVFALGDTLGVPRPEGAAPGEE